MGRKGFTLVEVLIVIIIIGILAAIGIPQFAANIEKAKGGEARAGLGFIQTAEKIYYAENDTYVGGAGFQTSLDLSLSESYWTFAVSATTGTYTATATRSSGVYSGQTLTMNQAGTIGGNWIYI